MTDPNESVGVDYSEVANAQLDALESGPDAGLCNAVCEACELIFTDPVRAQATSSTIITGDGRTVLRYPVPDHPPYKVFWTSTGPRIEAVFPHL